MSWLHRLAWKILGASQNHEYEAFLIKPEEVPQLLKAMAECGIETAPQFFNYSATLMLWVIKHVRGGAEIVARYEDKDVELQANFIQFIRRIKETDH
jgi:hypothetical protein